MSSINAPISCGLRKKIWWVKGGIMKVMADLTPPLQPPQKQAVGCLLVLIAGTKFTL